MRVKNRVQIKNSFGKTTVLQAIAIGLFGKKRKTTFELIDCQIDDMDSLEDQFILLEET